MLEAAVYFVLAYSLTIGYFYLSFHSITWLHHVIGALLGLVWVGLLRNYRRQPLSPFTIWSKRRAAQRAREHWQERKRRRIAELSADPVKRKYIPLVELGQNWSDEEIEYQEDSSATACCSHLQPVERAMRQNGLALRRLQGANVRADCYLDWEAVQRQFEPPASVNYREWYQPERHWADNPQAALFCAECKSSICVLHPADPRPNTNWFPSAPTRPEHSPVEK